MAVVTYLPGLVIDGIGYRMTELAYVVLHNFIEAVTFTHCTMMSMTAVGPRGTRMLCVR